MKSNFLNSRIASKALIINVERKSRSFYELRIIFGGVSLLFHYTNPSEEGETGEK